MRLIQSFSGSESKSFQRFGVRKQPSGSRGLGLKLHNPAVQLISKPRDVYNSTPMCSNVSLDNSRLKSGYIKSE